MKITADDNIAIALQQLQKGESIEINNQKIKILADIPFGHKIALEDIHSGEQVIRYGYPIGLAISEIKKGGWVHSHNLKTGLKGKIDYTYQPVDDQPVGYNEKQETSQEQEAGLESPVFNGYKRKDGKAGIRNEIWIINTVGCINKQTQKLAFQAQEKFKEEIETGKIDGIYNFTHPYGCSQLGKDLENTQKLLAGLVKHPNAGGVLIIGLGCENNQLSDFEKFIGDYDPERVKTLILQEVEDGNIKGMELLSELVEYAGQFAREPLPVSELVIGLKCGGSDSFSGITANPLVGRISDKIVSYGGTSILTEVPEMFGAETILMDRARNKETFNDIVNLINDFKNYFIKNDQEVYENPSPGNKEGGITTLEEKSLGCTQKGGHSEVVDVLKYGDQIKIEGLNLLESPGNDLVSTTALTSAGAHIILFTTGRGTPFAPPAPTVKIATNTELFNRKNNWMDFDAGQLMTGKGMDELSAELFADILEYAGGKSTKNELNDFRDMAIFKTGVTL